MRVKRWSRDGQGREAYSNEVSTALTSREEANAFAPSSQFKFLERLRTHIARRLAAGGKEMVRGWSGDAQGMVRGWSGG